MQQSLRLGMINAERLALKEWKSPSPSSFQRGMTDRIGVTQMEILWLLRTNSIKKIRCYLGFIPRLPR